MNTIQEKIFNVPTDVCLDIFKVLLENKVEFKKTEKVTTVKNYQLFYNHHEE